MENTAMFRTAERRSLWALIPSLLAGMNVLADGRSLDIELRDQRGDPLAGAAVYAIPKSATAKSPQDELTAVINQVNNEFVPEMLVVETGTRVTFLNSDATSHHVYSFSKPKTFQLGLFKGDAHPPVLFDNPGLVILGCNIHDLMIGYVFVVDTPWFGTTDADGKVELTGLADGDYTLKTWSPVIRPGDPVELAELTLDAEVEALRYQLKVKTVQSDDEDSSLFWGDY